MAADTTTHSIFLKVQFNKLYDTLTEYDQSITVDVMERCIVIAETALADILHDKLEGRA